MAEEIKFNDKIFLMVREEEGWGEKYRYYVDNNPDNKLECSIESLSIIITTSFFPNKQYGYGIESNVVTSEPTTSFNAKPFYSEYDAQFAAYKKIKDFRFSLSRYIDTWKRLLENLRMHFEPNNLFDNPITKTQIKK